MVQDSSSPSRPLRATVVMAITLLGLTACSGSNVLRDFGLTRDSPDEFTVTTRAPLSMPPDYTLHAPQPGAPRPQEQSAPASAEAALVPQAVPGAGAAMSPGQQAIVNAAGPPAPADIRSQVDAQAALDAPGRSFVDRLMFWKSPPLPGTVVDPQQEAQRLRDNAALGQSENQGTTPIIQPKQENFLRSLF